MGSYEPLPARLALHLAHDCMLDFTSCFFRVSVPGATTHWALFGPQQFDNASLSLTVPGDVQGTRWRLWSMS